MLYVEDLEVEVGGKTILENVNMSIPRGQTHILFGPNGSGKSSLMMTIMGFSEYKVTRGKITFDEDEVISTIVRGFLNVNIEGLPSSLAGKLDKAVAETQKDAM